MAEPIKVGDAVIYHDENGVAHPAIVTAAWTQVYLNLVFVSADDKRQDTFGRQIERETSVHHVSDHQVHGRYWRRESEAARPYTAPQAV